MEVPVCCKSGSLGPCRHLTWAVEQAEKGDVTLKGLIRGQFDSPNGCKGWEKCWQNRSAVSLCQTAKLRILPTT